MKRIKYIWYYLQAIYYGVRCLLFGHEWVITDDLEWRYCWYCPDGAEEWIYHPRTIHQDVTILNPAKFSPIVLEGMWR